MWRRVLRAMSLPAAIIAGTAAAGGSLSVRSRVFGCDGARRHLAREGQCAGREVAVDDPIDRGRQRARPWP